MKIILIRVLATLCLATLLFAQRLLAQGERILDYHSDVVLHDDQTLTVVETIRVVSQNNQIRHGIYREFPTSYKDNYGNRYVVGFTLLGATRDGEPEQTRIEEQLNGKRIYLGDKDTFVSVGDHVYTISYQTNRQLGFFKDHDELYWNVTGNGWVFSIEHASATVHFPPQVPADEVRLSGFTGVQGSMERSLETRLDEGAFQFVTSRPLRSREGLSITMSFPKGYFVEPTARQKLTYFVEDNRDTVIGGAGLLLILLYYFLVWSAVGRDPARGVIMPQYEPPSNFSPAAMRYLVRMSFDNKAFTAAILNMAVRGYLTIREQAGSYTLYRTKADDSALSPDEKEIARQLFAGRDQIWLHNENHKMISGAIKSLRTWLKTAEQKIYFFTNSRYTIPAILLSIVVLLGVIAMQGTPKILIAGFLCVWLTIWTCGVAGLLMAAGSSWKSVLDGSGSRALAMGQALFLSIFALPFLGGEAMGLFFFAKLTSIAIVALLLLYVLIHIAFHYLLKAPTLAGRKILDKIEGFKMFLGAVDGDRLNRISPPEKTPEVFEKFLPYALALDVHQEWAKKFDGVLDSAGRSPGGQGSSYSPSWYSGPGIAALGAAGLASSIGGSFSSAISSSSTAPGSSSGSGGSGGGGGGGGGGGW